MDVSNEILLSRNRNINSIDVDLYGKIELNNNVLEINEYNVRNVVNATELFDAERSASEVYRIYGRIEFLSMLNGLVNEYPVFSDFFNSNENSLTHKNILNSFDFYLVRPCTGYTKIGSVIENTWVRYFEVIATPKEFDIYPAGYSNNLFNEQGFAFNFNVDIDVSSSFDEFGFPMTELFLYAQYKKSPIYDSSFIEYLSMTTWNSHALPIIGQYDTIDLNIGDVLKNSQGVKIGDVVSYDKKNYLQTQSSQQEYYISIPYIDISSTAHRLVFKYNPFTPIRLRYLSDSVYNVNTGTTSYDLLQSIPTFATNIGDGNYVWRNIMPEGYYDPLTGVGTNYPFVNRCRYLFTSILLSVIPDMNDNWTNLRLNEIYFNENKINFNTLPTGDIDNIGKPCK